MYTCWVIFDSCRNKVHELAVHLGSWVGEKVDGKLIKVGLGRKPESINLGHSQDNKCIALDEYGNWIADAKSRPQSSVITRCD